MLGLRYHVASLAAVFLALAVGILLGVAISGKVSDAENAFQEQELRAAEQDRDAAQARAEAAEQRGEAAAETFEGAYPALMEERLADRAIAVLFLGAVDGSARAAIEETLRDADAGSPVLLLSLDVPIDSEEMENTLAGNELLAAFAGGDGDFGDLGRELGRELVDGDGAPRWTALSSRLVAERSGGFTFAVDGVVVMYSWAPAVDESDDPAASPGETLATESLLRGLVSGLESTGVPVVGVADTMDPEGLTELYRRGGISSVDNVDTFSGRLALAVLLAGGEPGHYGAKDSATDGATPPVETPSPETGE